MDRLLLKLKKIIKITGCNTAEAVVTLHQEQVITTKECEELWGYVVDVAPINSKEMLLWIDEELIKFKT